MSEIFVVTPEIVVIVDEERDKTFKEIFTNLSGKDVSEFVEKKQGLDYLPWSDCYNVLSTEYPSTQYHTYWFPDDNLRWNRYCKELVGYSVQMGITIKGIHKTMSLPVWSGRPPKSILEPDSMDINSAIMRCGVKCAALFGLGLYLYQGEDLPVEVKTTKVKTKTKTETGVITEQQRDKIEFLIAEKATTYKDVVQNLGNQYKKDIPELHKLNSSQAIWLINQLETVI